MSPPSDLFCDEFWPFSRSQKYFEKKHSHKIPHFVKKVVKKRKKIYLFFKSPKIVTIS
jgi:hypothetical protein